IGNSILRTVKGADDGLSHTTPLVGSFVFFFQAEDGIRDRNVTGVQTCALPILRPVPSRAAKRSGSLTPQQPPTGRCYRQNRWKENSSCHRTVTFFSTPST